MQLDPSARALYPFLAAVFDDVCDWLEKNSRFLTIIAKHSNTTASNIASLVKYKEPKVVVSITINKDTDGEFDSREFSNIPEEFNLPISEKLYSRIYVGIPIIRLDVETIQLYESNPGYLNNALYGANQNYFRQPICYPNDYLNNQLSYRELSTEQLLDRLKQPWFRIAYIIVHEFMHYVNWFTETRPEDLNNINGINITQSKLEDDDDYKVELCSRELYNFDWPYYYHNYFNGRGNPKNELNQVIILRTSGIYYEWDLAFHRLRKKISTIMRSSQHSQDYKTYSDFRCK